jgi:hypothetical protein
MKKPGKTDEILRRKAASGQPSVVRRTDPVTGEVIERILPPSQPDPRPWTARHYMNWKRAVSWSVWWKTLR